MRAQRCWRLAAVFELPQAPGWHHDRQQWLERLVPSATAPPVRCASRPPPPAAPSCAERSKTHRGSLHTTKITVIAACCTCEHALSPQGPSRSSARHGDHSDLETCCALALPRLQPPRQYPQAAIVRPPWSQIRPLLGVSQWSVAAAKLAPLLVHRYGRAGHTAPAAII